MHCYNKANKGLITSFPLDLGVCGISKCQNVVVVLTLFGRVPFFNITESRRREF